ncbi:MAG: alpha/beta hydrolase [Bacillota bacterium]|nr:alpha/beta hydrolase [Bacillota bacterium]
MKILDFGNRSKPVIILIHGFQMPWQIWDVYMEHYRDDFHILVPVMPGHDPDHREDFVSFSRTAEEFEDFFLSKYGGEVFAVAAMSMGGVLAARLWLNKRLQIQNMLLDGTPLLPLGHFMESVMLSFYLRVTHKAQQRDRKTLEQARQLCPEKNFADFLAVLDAMTDTTIRNCIRGVADFRLPADISSLKTRICYFHGTKLNETLARKSARRLAKQYNHLTIRRFKGKSHCENMLFHPQVMLKEFDACLL